MAIHSFHRFIHRHLRRPFSVDTRSVAGPGAVAVDNSPQNSGRDRQPRPALSEFLANLTASRRGGRMGDVTADTPGVRASDYVLSLS